jgi:hypothetical protein
MAAAISNFFAMFVLVSRVAAKQYHESSLIDSEWIAEYVGRIPENNHGGAERALFLWMPIGRH